MKKTVALLFISIIVLSSFKNKQSFNTIELPVPKRETNQTDVLELRCNPIDTVRIAIIGVGMRGVLAVNRFCNIENVRIVAICDIRAQNTLEAQKILVNNKKPLASLYTGEEDWKLISQRNDIDLVYICTPWLLHTPIAVYAMNHGKHVAIEVPAATTVKECWQLVDTSEKTRKHCIMLENCNYDFFEMTTLNMAQKGKFGTLVHGEGGYLHDLRFLNFETSESGYQDMWRLKYNTIHTGNPYATHGLGPIAHTFNIHRGDRMKYLTSISSDQFGMTEYAKEKFGEKSEFAKKPYQMGDMNTTIIRTELGKTIMLQHNITNPRPYSRLHTIYGTKGYAQKYPLRNNEYKSVEEGLTGIPAGLSFDPKGHEFLIDEQMKDTMSFYEHPISKELGKLAREVGGHGGMDFIMDYRLIYCLRKGLPLDMDVYDAAEWSCIGELTELSVKNNGAPVEIPDFTRGAWKKLETITYYK